MNKIIEQDCIDIIKYVDLDSLRDRAVLVTGSNGLLGQYLVSAIYYANKINQLNCKIYCASLHGPNKTISALLPDDNIISLQIDLSKPFSLDLKVDYIFHAACYAQPSKFINDPFSTIKLNVDATQSLLELAKNNKARFVFFSSAEVYGDIPKDLIPVPEDYNGNCSTTSNRAIYGESKRLGETICSIYKKNYDVQVYIARISHTYGPGISINDQRVLGDFIRKALVDKKIVLLDSGSAVKTFGYIADIIKMLLLIILKGSDMIYNVGGIDSLSIKELAEAVGSYCQVPVIIPEEKADLKHIGNDPAVVKLDLTKIKKEFNFTSFVNFSEGISKNIEWNKIEFNL